MEELLARLHREIKWSNLKHQDKKVAVMMEEIAPLFVEATIKLSKTRHIQAQSTAKRKQHD